MRKPLVVVGVAAALLFAGGITATTAGAEETPDVPGMPGFTMPDFFGWSGFGGAASDDSDDADADDDALPAADDDSDDAGAAGDDAGDGSDVGDGSDMGDGSDVGDAAPGLADTPDRPGGAAARPAQAAEPVRERPAVPVRPGRPAVAAQDRPAPVRQKPAGTDLPGFAQRPAAGTLVTGARQDVTSADVSASPAAPVQQRVLALINQYRRRGGCGELSVDRRLIEAANEHAADMARRRYFAHESPDGDGAGDRVHEVGYRWKRYGENIARGVDSPYDVVQGWMHSPAHRENIMDCSLHQVGVGLALSRDHTAYWVQDFATPMT